MTTAQHDVAAFYATLDSEITARAKARGEELKRLQAERRARLVPTATVKGTFCYDYDKQCWVRDSVGQACAHTEPSTTMALAMRKAGLV